MLDESRNVLQIKAYQNIIFLIKNILKNFYIVRYILLLNIYYVIKKFEIITWSEMNFFFFKLYITHIFHIFSSSKS